MLLGRDRETAAIERLLSEARESRTVFAKLGIASRSERFRLDLAEVEVPA